MTVLMPWLFNSPWLYNRLPFVGVRVGLRSAHSIVLTFACDTAYSSRPCLMLSFLEMFEGRLSLRFLFLRACRLFWDLSGPVLEAGTPRRQDLATCKLRRTSGSSEKTPTTPEQFLVTSSGFTTSRNSSASPLIRIVVWALTALRMAASSHLAGSWPNGQ